MENIKSSTERIVNMMPEPTDYLAKSEVSGIVYGVDLQFRIWNLETMEIVYQEHGIGEIDLRKVLDGEVLWENSSDVFTFNDFLTECLLL